MNHKPLPIGIDNFEKLITRGYYFIDKSLLIKDLLDNKASVNLFTRPIGSKICEDYNSFIEALPKKVALFKIN